jgi:16S rRNA C1402 (ribose-2'-O) methylase RsmI
MTTTRVTPTLANLRRYNGTAGQFSLAVEVTYPGEDTRTVEFVGSVYGGPVLMVTDAGQTWVTDPGRFGSFGKAWVAKFFA